MSGHTRPTIGSVSRSSDGIPYGVSWEGSVEFVGMENGRHTLLHDLDVLLCDDHL